MIKMVVNRTKEEWARVFSQAKHGHILWDGLHENPTNPEHAYVTAYEFVDFAKINGMFLNGSRILDIGCGNGRFGIPFSEMNVSYDGIEPMQECVDFCKFAFSQFKNLRFHHTSIKNPEYGPGLVGQINPENFKIEFSDNTFDDVIAYSVFTHLQTLPIAENYIKEIKRVLKPGGKFFVTWYRSPPDKSPDSYAGRSVFNEWDIMNLLKGFSFIRSYGGHSGEFFDQWGIFCQLD